jgi:hypothetical protein
MFDFFVVLVAWGVIGSTFGAGCKSMALRSGRGQEADRWFWIGFFFGLNALLILWILGWNQPVSSGGSDQPSAKQLSTASFPYDQFRL